MKIHSALAVGLFALTSGCSDDDPPPPAPPPPVSTRPPTIDPLAVPTWPPMGPGGAISVRCSDDVALTSVTAEFRAPVTRTVAGREATLSFAARDLGEGMGTFSVRCCATSSLCVERTIRDYLIDLTPPEIEEDRSVASPNGDGFDGQISIWVRDAWLLGTVELTYAGKTFRHELPQAYPDTLGEEWDVTRVAFPARDFAAGAGMAVVVARDAAGNVATKEFSIRVDATPPTVAFLAPAAGASAEGNRVGVRLSASDADNTVPPTIELFAGGTRIAELVGPLGEITLDTSTLPSGPTELRAIARDNAGNKSAPATVAIVVP